MNRHDWIRFNRPALDRFEVWLKEKFPFSISDEERRKMLTGWLGCWETLKAAPAPENKAKRAWNGMVACGVPIKRMHFHRTEADAVCALPRQPGKDHCWRHKPKGERNA